MAAGFGTSEGVAVGLGVTDAVGRGVGATHAVSATRLRPETEPSRKVRRFIAVPASRVAPTFSSPTEPSSTSKLPQSTVKGLVWVRVKWAARARTGRVHT